MTRKWVRSPIQELEELFTEQNDSINLLLELQEELTYRTTNRATRLRILVTEHLSVLTAEISSREQTRPDHQDQLSSRTRVEPVHRPEPPASKAPGTSKTLESGGGRVPAPMPPITNRPEEILSGWMALEVLSPPAYLKPEDLAGGDRSRVATLNGVFLPWERGESSRPNYRLYYQVVLGSIKMEPALEKLMELYGDARPEKPRVHGKAVLAIVVVDQHGLLVESPAVGISSFAWGVISALNGDLASLARWPEVEPQLVERIEHQLLGDPMKDKTGEEPRSRPLTSTALFSAYEALVHDLGLPMEWVEPPAIAIRSYAYYKDPDPPEAIVLNSFFLKDLALARRLFTEGNAPQNLRNYLGVDRPQARGDLLCDKAVLEEAVSPLRTPLSRWPGKDRHPLVLLQQAAVNLSFQETKASGMLGINGPPGTGKTTLFRDLVAGVVAERAEEMAKFDDPETAFENSGLRLRAGNSWTHLYRLNPSLRGFEMVVASSNNKAVENVSAELPGLDAIASDATELRYFKTLSDALHQTETWGAIAAVLGSVQNRSRFKQVFWWDGDNGMNSYLWASTGPAGTVEITDQETGQVERRTARIIEAEQPPSTREDALERWKSARKRFLDALDKSRNSQTCLESLRAELAGLPILAQAETSAAANRDAATETVRRIEAAATVLQQTEAEASSQFHHASQELDVHVLAKPGFLARLFRTRTLYEWSEKLEVLRANQRRAEIQYTKGTVDRQHNEDELRRELHELETTETAWEMAFAQHQNAEQRLAEAQQKYAVVFANDAFFALERGKLHQMTPWFSPAAQRLRDEVFIAAMAVHHAFIGAAAKPLRHNLGALMNAFTTQTLPGAEKQALLPDLWASFFLVVPLVSTTFASVNRMLGNLPLESLGWLLVDEAGQALPQAAVGALLRTRRAVIVGDPVQIEPVVVLPDTLTHAICHRFGVDPDRYSAPIASVQTLADAASGYTSEFQTRVGSRSVGVPLLVHRRCSEPMFGISNAIAYAGLMVPAKSLKQSPIRDLLGPSRWIDVEGSGEDKWCSQEGVEVLRLLRQIAEGHVKPDLYIITPFGIVADRLRQVVCESGVLRAWAGEDEWRWAKERIGTVHTAQGREAEAVILVLGAPHPGQTGARGWAGSRPNLVNVAATRAKEVIYVVGNRHLWCEAGFFRELDKRLL